MRTRSVIALSVAALAAIALAGCSASTSASPNASPSSSAVDLCSAKVASGTASDAVTVSGEVGKQAEVSFTAPLDVAKLESTVLTKGTGEKLKSGDLVQFALTEHNAKTGAVNGAVGQDENTLLPQPISADSILGKVLGCATVGTRVVATIPGDSSTPASVDVIDVLKVVPDAAWGTKVAPQDGFPTVKIAKDGEPSVTLPKDEDAPTAFKKETLKKGDGPVVAKGDSVLVQYYGYSWDNKKSFDKSWGGQPFTFTVGQGVAEGFSDAVEGETVGSQVVAVLPPSVAYGEGKINDKDLKGQTLVFVIDILGAQHAAG